MEKLDEKKCIEIKKIVKSNFDLSLKKYEAFESKTSLFKILTNVLASFCGIKKGVKVIDIGSGSGISTFEIAKLTGSKGFVYGIDISEVMLKFAEKMRGRSNIKYICCDAEKLSSFINEEIDFAFYSASIFLIPDIEASLNEVCKVFNNNGKVSASYLKGIYIEDKIDLFNEIKRKTNIPVSEKRILHSEDFIESAFTKYFPFVEKKEWSYPITVSDFKAFYSTKAPLASIFPKLTYQERLIKIFETVNVIKNWRIPVMNMKWVLFKGGQTDEII